MKQQCQSEGRDGMGGERRGKVKRESWHHCLEREFNGVCVPVCRCVSFHKNGRDGRGEHLDWVQENCCKIQPGSFPVSPERMV